MKRPSVASRAPRHWRNDALRPSRIRALSESSPMSQGRASVGSDDALNLVPWTGRRLTLRSCSRRMKRAPSCSSGAVTGASAPTPTSHGFATPRRLVRTSPRRSRPSSPTTPPSSCPTRTTICLSCGTSGSTHVSESGGWVPGDRWLRRGPFVFFTGRRFDDVAYGAGLWWGAAGSSSARVLMPRRPGRE